MLASFGAMRPAFAKRVVVSGLAADNRSSSMNIFSPQHSAKGFLQTADSVSKDPWPTEVDKMYKKIKYISGNTLSKDYLVEDKVTSKRAVLKLAKWSSHWVNKHYMDLYIGDLSQAGIVEMRVERVCNLARSMTSMPEEGRYRWMMCYENGIDDPESSYIVTEYLGDTNLKLWQNKLKTKLNLPTVADMKRIVKMLLQAVQLLEKRGITHRNIKEDNIAVLESDGKPNVKITSFLSIKRDSSERVKYHSIWEDKEFFKSPRVNQPPETIYNAFAPMESPYIVKHTQDIYAIGSVVFRMLCGSKSERGKKDWGIPSVFETDAAYGNGNQFKYTEESMWVDEKKIKEKNSLLQKSFEAYLSNEGPWKYCRDVFLLKHKDTQLFEEYGPVLGLMGEMLRPESTRPGATELLDHDLLEDVETGSDEIKTEADWVADHLAEQEKFEKKRDTKIESAYDSCKKWRRRVSYEPVEFVFNKQDIPEFKAKCKAWIPDAPFHLLE